MSDYTYFWVKIYLFHCKAYQKKDTYQGPAYETVTPELFRKDVARMQSKEPWNKKAG